MMPNNTFTTSEVDKILHIKSMARSNMDYIIGDDDSYMKLHLVMAGGAFVSWFYNQTPKDIDIFVLDDENCKRLLRDRLTDLKFKSKDLEYMKQTNDGAKHVQEVWEGTHRGRVYQFIFTDCKTREELLADFDYKHCMVSYKTDHIYITRTIYDAIEDKKLITNNAKTKTIWREEKFLRKGWTIPVDAPPSKLAAYQNMLDDVKAKLIKELEENGQ
jgi:hypothetical protein